MKGREQRLKLSGGTGQTQTLSAVGNLWPDGTGYFQMDDTKGSNPWYSCREKEPFRVYQEHESSNRPAIP